MCAAVCVDGLLYVMGGAFESDDGDDNFT
jgi:hypothetical protein